MTVRKMIDGTSMTLTLSGRIDTSTAPQLESEISDLTGIDYLVFDFGEIEYISSAGLRVLLTAQKKMQKKDGGKFVLKNINDTVSDVLEITGFSDILTIE